MSDYIPVVGSLVIGYVVGDGNKYIAEILSTNPQMVFKVQEKGPYSAIKGDEFFVDIFDTKEFQANNDRYINELNNRGQKIYSGLRTITNHPGNEILEIIPG